MNQDGDTEQVLGLSEKGLKKMGRICAHSILDFHLKNGPPVEGKRIMSNFGRTNTCFNHHQNNHEKFIRFQKQLPCAVCC